MGASKKMTPRMDADLVSLIKDAGKGCYIYLCDKSRTYKQLPLDPCDWCLVCLKVQGHYFLDISLTFRLRWEASCCQDNTSLKSRAFRDQVGTVLNYINDFVGVATDQHTTT